MVKHPLKPHYLPFLTLATGLVGFCLRLWLYATGIDGKGLFIPNHPANILIFVLTATTMGLMVLCVLPLNRSPVYNKLFPPSLLSFIGCLVGCAGILATDVYELMQRADIVTILSLIMGLLAAGSLLYVGFCRYQGVRPGFLFRGIVTVYFMLHLVSQYRLWSNEPQLQSYFFSLLASILLMFSAYQRTTLDAGQGVRRWYVFSNQAAVFFCFLAAVGEGSLFYFTMGFWTMTELCTLRRIRIRKKIGQVMFLPKPVRMCMDRLEDAGYRAYAVGGCVRDSLLGIQPHDYDLCTDAKPSTITKLFSDHNLVRSGEKHGTIGVVIDHNVYEITTFRTEGDYTDGRHPGWVQFVSTIEEDLARRDFTVNAMAYSPIDGYIDPWGGKQDLEDRVLRAVGDPETRFREDALRILRGVRFGVRFRLKAQEETRKAMFALAPLMDNLARERVFDELCKLLPTVTAQDLLEYQPIITQVIPELAPCVDFQQHSPYHAFDVYTHIAHVTAGTPAELALRWAALLHDVGKPGVFTMDQNGRGHFHGHAGLSADIAQQVLLRLKAPTVLREQVLFLVKNHMIPFEPDVKILRRRLGRHGLENCLLLLALQRADFCNKGTQGDSSYFHQLEQMLRQLSQEETCFTIKDLAIDGNDLIAMGFVPGPEIGKVLTTLLACVQDDILPNEKDDLLRAAEQLKD